MDNQLKKQIEINDRNIFSPEQKKYSVYLPKYGITVQTALTDAREIMFSTEISALKQSRDLYFALGRLGESKKDFTNGFFKQAAKGLGASAVNIAGNLYGAAVNLGWKGVNEVALQWTVGNKAAEVSTQEELAFATKVDKAKYEEAERAREAWTKRQRADLQDFMQKAGLDKTQFDGFVYDLISGGGTAVAALAVGAITKSPGAVAAMFGAVSGQDYYGEALEAGLTGDKALAVGFGAGALEGTLERYGTEQLFKAMASTKAFKTPIRAIMRYARQKGVYGVAEAGARGALTEGAEEFTQNIASSAVMNTAGVRDDSYDEIIAESFYGAMLGALVGGGMAGAGRAAALAASKLEKAGMPKDIAKDVAGKIIEQAYEKESIEEAIKLAESENSPLTYENSDKAAAARKFGEQVRDFADPEKRARAAREAWNIKDAVEKEALKAGLSPEQAATAAQAYQSAANMYFDNTGVMPKDWWEQYRLEIQNDMQNRAGGKESDTFYQAAMYKSRAKNLVEFKKNARENRKSNRKQFYSIKGSNIDIAQDSIISDKNKGLTNEDLDVIEKSLENPSIKSFSILDDKGSYNGKSVILNIKTAKGNLAVLIEVAESERILFKEASFKEPIQNRAGMHTFTDNAASPGHIYSIDDVIDAVNMEYEKSISQKSVSELEKIINSLNENITNKQKRVYDKHNFYKKTINDFKNAQAPKRLPDYVSASGSKYWIEKGGVYRQSDHWGKVSTNEWSLDGKESVGAEKTGYARWQDFGYNGAQDKARLAKYENVLKRKGVVATEGEKDNRFNQAPAEGARGYVEFTGQGVFMRLLEEADPSTVVHEVCGHVLLRNVEDIKSFAEVNGGAREEFNGIWEDLEKWLGPAERVEENGKVKYRFNRAQQEMFAEGMEKMFAAGKAPTGTLEKIFKYFREMLSAMYAEAREWLNLRPEVEELFGKILAGTQIESADSKIYKGRAADVKAVSARARKGEAASINGLGIKEVKALIKQLGRRRPAMPKEDLLTVLKRKGADYANAAKIDAEAYANAGVKDKAGGIKDDAALWLKEEGFAVDISEEQAWALIEKALDGEKVYRPEDMERIAAIENFDANIEAIREAFGGNIREAEETLRAIEDLEAKGYRVIGNSDVEYAEEQTDKLLSYAERERELKKQIANLTEDKEELGNIAERRLKEISRRAALAREEGYKEAIKDAQDKKTVKDLLAVEREAEKNALDARRVKNALIEELGKRELSGKEEMLKALKEAQGTEEITSAAVKLISALHKSFEGTQEGQAEKRKTDLPVTNWAQVKVKALGNFGKTLKEAGADVKRAQALEKQASAARLKGIKLDDKTQAQVDNARSKVLKGYALKYARALKEAFAGVPHIDGVWLDKAANAIGREYAGRENIIGRSLEQLIERAKKRQAENYKRYLGEKIEKIISAGYKVKDGQKQKGKYDYVTNKLFEDLAHIKNMDKTAAKAELERRLKIINNAPSNAEAALKIFELDGEAENISPDFVENIKFENAWLAFKAGKMSDKEMAMAKESLAEQGLPEDIGEDRWHNVTPEFLSEFYEDLTQRRQAALEGRLSKSAELAFKVREAREDYAKAVRENGKAGFLTKGYINNVANWESIHNAFANKEISEKYSLLEAEAQAEVKTNEKMKEIVRQVSETLGAKDAKAVKKWFDGLDEEAGVWQNRMESKRMALQEAAPAVRQQMEAVDEFRKLLSGKEEIILKDFLSFTDAHGEKKNHNLKIAFDGKDGGLKSIFEEQGYEGVMKAVHAALKGLIVKNDGNTVFIRVRNDFAAVLKYSNPGGKGTYTLIDYALFDEKGRQTAGYGVRVKQVNAGVLNPVEFKKGIEELIRADKTRVKKIDIGPVSSQLVQAAKAHNIDIYGYRHNIDNSAINHTLKRHGNKKMEESRGQIAVTAEDFLKIPEILNNPDYIAFGAKNKKGLDLIVYGKNMPDGSSIYIEEIRSETLTANSMRKYKGSLDSSSFAKRIGNAHNTQTSNISIVEKNGNVKGGELKQKEASEAFPSPKEGATEATDSLTEKKADVNSKKTLFDEKGRQSAGYGVRANQENAANSKDIIKLMPNYKEYENPSKNFVLPDIPDNILNILGKRRKPVLLKISIIDKTKSHHKDLKLEEYNQILANGLYNADLILQTDPEKKPNYFNFVAKSSKHNDNVVIEFAENKDNYEIVSFYKISEESLKDKINRTNRNGGQSVKTQKGGASPISTPAVSSDNTLIQKEADVNSKETAFEIKKAALNAAQNALNPYMDGIYKPVSQKLTKGQIIDIYNMAKNPVGYARLENQYGYDQLTEMFSLLSKEDKQIADHWQKTVEEGHGEINKVFIKQYGLDMGSPAHYWPFSVERITSEVDMLGQNYAEARRPGLTKSRTSGQLVEMKPMNPVEKLYKHYGRAMQYVHTAEKVSWLRRVLRDSKIKKTIEEHFGEDAAKTLYELLDNSTMGVGKNSVKHYEDGVMNWLTNNYVKAAIAAKPSIALKQLISVVNYAENMPAGQWAEGFVKALGDFKNTIDFMMQDPYLKTRWENGTQNEALMRALAQDFGKTKGVKALNSFTNILAINVRLGDIGAIFFGGKPYIDYLMQSKGMSKEEAFRQFRLDTLRSQQASQRSSLSRLQAKEMNWLMRALFAFKNTGNQYVRKIADAIIMYKRGEIDAKQLAKTVAIYAVINQYLYVAATSLGMLGAAYAGFDDEDKNREMLAEFMVWPAQNFGFLPILDDAVNQASYRLTNLALGGKAGALRNPEVPLIKDVYDAVRSLGKDDLTFEDWVNAAAPLAQTATGLPVKYFASAAKTPYELAEGNFTKTALILGGWTPKRAEKVSGD